MSTIEQDERSLVIDAPSRRNVLAGMAAATTIALTASPPAAQAAPTTFDFVVVGSGPGGGPVACNLAKAGYSVCLLEAGGPATQPDLELEIALPIEHPAVTGDPRVAWSYFVRHYADQTQQEKDTKFVAAENGVLYPRASTVGGCATHSALVMVYPSNADWQNIVDLTGDTSWAPDIMRGYFQRLEQCLYQPDNWFTVERERHGFKGWQSTDLANPAIFANDPQTLRLIAAAETVVDRPGSRALRPDPNDYRVTQEERVGVYSIPLSTKNGARWSIRDYVLATAASHPNLTIMTNCLASRIILDDSNTARGVEYVTGPNLYRASPLASAAAPLPPASQVFAAREVILAAGTFNSPQLLKLSGIGPAAELAHLGIKTRVDLPGVGTGMMDRYEVGVVTQMKTPLTLFNACTGGANDPCLTSWQAGMGPYSYNGFSAAGILKSDPHLPVRDLVINQVFGNFQGYYPGYQASVFNPQLQTWLILKAFNKNRAGTVTLKSTDPRDTPVIDFHYFEEGTDAAGEDLRAVVEAVKLARRMNAQVSDLVAGELVPGPSVQSDSDIETFVKNEAWGHHASCSNHMGPRWDPMAVVNSDFQVYGTRNLRVVDASVFPSIPGYYITVPILMISEKASDVILAATRVHERR